MAKPVFLTREMLSELSTLLSLKNEKFEVTPPPKPLEKRYSVSYNERATLKELLAIMCCDTEIGWSGVVDRISDTDFLITDILIPPQTVSATSYRTDDEEYAKWIQQLCANDYNNLRLNGHSHVNMCVSPSEMDLELQEETVKQLPPTDYYIFTIKNKKGDAKFWIYDLKNNLLVTENEIDVKYFNQDYRDFCLKEIASKCKQKSSPIYIRGIEDFEDSNYDFEEDFEEWI